jgi:hypothetical protein
VCIKWINAHNNWMHALNQLMRTYQLN